MPRAVPRYRNRYHGVLAVAVALLVHAGALAWCATVRFEHLLPAVSLRGESMTIQAAMMAVSSPAPQPEPFEPEEVVLEPIEEVAVVVEPQAIQVGAKRFDRESTRVDIERPSLEPPPRHVEQNLPDRAAAHDKELTEREPTKTSSKPKPRENLRQPQFSRVSIPRRVGMQTELPQPEFARSPPPSYPRAAIDATVEGTVVLAVTIEPDGQVSRVEVEQSSGYAILDGAAVAAIRRWQARPLTELGRDIALTINLPIRFHLPR